MPDDRTPSLIDDLLAHVPVSAAAYREQAPPILPARHVTVVTCMDARVDPLRIFGLDLSDVHIIRNAGGIVTDDTLRSLAISQRMLETREVLLLHHTGCGLDDLDDAAFLDTLEAESGTRPEWRPGGFTDVDADVRASVRAVEECPWLVSPRARGFVFDVADGTVREVR